ncbi:polysaccharide pyruvyl transferase CsaB [Planomicrobium sp. MB-3u-38]|uniref:polysaccharide pyruvyl transferase CsaB n=1 Tax=Planomicrobium sp. MB-3u-38 TaxID=2058318 RepID=UPI000C7B7622|nr:polysaccharide pyruvyl transferase CsaB [Planomicrobium sp. MB-3u-38]PKH09079.1 polysaccharide pyruvyl transferase CsaB [Planomicrobium sp. MB-3u-38]
MRIVLSGYYGFDNVGDEAILFAIIQSLKEYHPGVNLTVLSNNPEKTAASYKVDAVNRWNINEVRKALKESDCLISGGGSLLQDETGMKSISYYSGVMKIAQFLKKPVFIYAQGMGPVKSKINRQIMKHVLQRSEMITVRDKHSKSFLQSIGVSKPIQLVPDPVMGIDASGFSSGLTAGTDSNKRVISVSIRNWTEDLSYLNKVAAGLDQLADNGHEILMVPMHGKYDHDTSKNVAGMMTNKVEIFPYDSSIEEKMAAVKESDVLLGMRLHALIFASVGNTPFVALSYDPKIDSFAEIVDQKVLGNVSSDDWSADDIVSSIEEILANYPKEIKKLEESVIPLQQKANDTAKQVIDFLLTGAKVEKQREYIVASPKTKNR